MSFDHEPEYDRDDLIAALEDLNEGEGRDEWDPFEEEAALLREERRLHDRSLRRDTIDRANEGEGA